MKVSEEMNEKVEEEKKQNNETPTGNFDLLLVYPFFL